MAFTCAASNVLHLSGCGYEASRGYPFDARGWCVWAGQRGDELAAHQRGGGTGPQAHLAAPPEPSSGIPAAKVQTKIAGSLVGASYALCIRCDRGCSMPVIRTGAVADIPHFCFCDRPSSAYSRGFSEIRPFHAPRVVSLRIQWPNHGHGHAVVILSQQICRVCRCATNGCQAMYSE